MSIEKEVKQIGKCRKQDIAELYARIEVLEQNLKAFKEYVKFSQDADDDVQMGTGRCSYEARQIENQMSMVLNASYIVDSRTFAMEMLTSAKTEA